MKQLAIKAENISKQYRLGEVGTGTLSHDLNRFWYKIRLVLKISIIGHL
jgi:lipopolysaccharide transport system ATP-binding protein